MSSSSVGSRLTMTSLAPLRFARDREPRRRVDHERRPDSQEQVAGERQFLRPPHRRFGHRLTERDRGRLDDPAAGRATRGLSGRLEPGPDPIKLVALPARKAGRIGAVAVQLDDAVGGYAGFLMQPIDVLRDDGRHLALRHQRRQRPMTAARARVLVQIVHGELAPPRLAPRLRAAQESLERNGLVPHPRAAGRAEVRHAAFGRDASAREPDDGPRLRDQGAKIDGGPR